MIGDLGFTAMFIAPIALFGWLLVSGLRSGVMRARGASYSRATQPRWFWALAAIYTAGIAVCATLFGRIVFNV